MSIWPYIHPQVIEITTMREVKKSFESGYDPKLNWLFVGTSPLFGSRLSLDEIEEVILGESEYSDSINGRYYVTVLILHGRLPVVKYGEVLCNLEDIEWLRRIVRATLDEISDGQERSS